MPARAERSWSLEAALEIFPEVRTLTERAVGEVEEFSRRREALAEDDLARHELEQQMRERISRWIREMEAFGADVKGLWLVDFDNGSGYYCWRWPEAELAHFHGYDEGFSGRIRIQ